MINSKKFFITRVIFVLFIALSFMAIIWYNENKDNPRVIEFLEDFSLTYLYDNDGEYLSDKDLKSTAENLARSFSSAPIDGNAAMVSVAAGNDHQIVFTYVYLIKADPDRERENAQKYFQIQKSRFCSNPLDIKRLKRLKGYDFIYSLEGRPLVSFTLKLEDCAI